MSNGIAARRRLSFGGIILVLLGLLLLWNNYTRDYSAWHLFVQYWPVLLILWGLVKLVDNLMARSAGQPAPRSLSGGDVVLLIFLIVLGLSAWGISQVRMPPPDDWDPDFQWVFGERYTFSDEPQVREVAADASIRIVVERGDILVHGEDGKQLRIVAKKTVLERTESQAKKRAGEMSIEVAETGGGYEIRPKGQTGDRTVRVDLEVYVPKGARVTARSPRGDIVVNNVAGRVTVEAQRGNVEIREIGGDVEVDSRAAVDTHVSGVKGNVKIAGSGSDVEAVDVGGQVLFQGSFYGSIRAQNVKGETRFLSDVSDIRLGPMTGQMEISGGDLRVLDLQGDATVLTSSKDISLENVGGAIRIENRRRGDVDVRLVKAPTSSVEITTGTGDVNLTLPRSATFELTAVSKSGDVESDFPGAELKPSMEGDDHRLEGKVGQRGPKISLRNSFGTITLRQAG